MPFRLHGRELFNATDGPKLKGEDVKDLQRALFLIGYDLGPGGPNNEGIDGIFGNNTEQAVRNFQQRHLDFDGSPLSVDGIVGEKTERVLDKILEDESRFIDSDGFLRQECSFEMLCLGYPLIVRGDESHIRITVASPSF